MIGSHQVVRVWARPAPTDLRKGFGGLTALVEREMGHHLRAGDLYLFVSRRRHLAKVLYWDGTGMCLFTKRLSGRRFARLWRQGGSAVPLRLTAAEMNLFLEGATAHRKSRKKTS